MIGAAFGKAMRCRAVVLVLLALLMLAGSPATADAPKGELLWPQGAPGAKGDTLADRPTLTAYLPEPAMAVGTAVVICPGGGYGGLAVDHEGWQFARWFNSFGVAAFVLEYRHRGRGYGHPAPLQDAQRAIRTVRAGADKWHIAPDRIGIIGFSAGGHLASTAGTHFDRGNANASDPIERVSCRPDFLILCYAVIAFEEPFTHRGSQENLLGANADAALVRSLSNEKQVTAETPPTFLFHTDEDKVVPPENSVQFYRALQRAGVPAEMHIYRTGPHGVGLAKGIPGTRTWPDRLKDWMQGQGLVGGRKQA
jgi:acetyl esterase/lipase